MPAENDFLDSVLLGFAVGAMAGVILGVLFCVMQAWRKHLRKR
jgi:hypothetical protein